MDFFDSYGIYFSRRRPSALGTRFASRTPAMHSPFYYARSACQVVLATDSLTARYFRPMFSLPLLHRPGRDLGAIKLTSNLKDLKPAKQAGKQPCIVCFHVERVLLRLPSRIPSYAGSVRLAGLCRSSIADDCLRRDGALTRLQTRTYGITSTPDGFRRCSCITV